VAWVAVKSAAFSSAVYLAETLAGQLVTDEELANNEKTVDPPHPGTPGVPKPTLAPVSQNAQADVAGPSGTPGNYAQTLLEGLRDRVVNYVTSQGRLITCLTPATAVFQAAASGCFRFCQSGFDAVRAFDSSGWARLSALCGGRRDSQPRATPCCIIF
jgi:hypothetical protein